MAIKTTARLFGRWCGRGMPLSVLAGMYFLASGALAAERSTLNFNSDWKFVKADPPGADKPAFDDSGWAAVSAPHTFNDTDTFDDWSLSGHRGEQDQWAGRTWYRKSFILPKSFEGKKVFIEFEAVRQVAEVYLNGTRLGICRTGFTPFGFDLTPHLRFGAPNVLAVMCDNRFMKDPWAADAANSKNQNGAGAGTPGRKLSELAAHFNASIPEEMDELQADQIPWNNPHWHPAHGGIYRNVFLHVTDPLHITLPLYSFLQTAGPYAYASEISATSALITVQVPLENARPSAQRVDIRVDIFDQEEKSVLTLDDRGRVDAGQQREFTLSGTLKNPLLWQPAYPHVYRVVCSARVDGKMVDTSEIPLGVRTVRWDAGTGFHLNGRHFKLRGWGQRPTDEWPGLGAAQPDWLHFHTLQLMKDAGANMVRWGHCAGGPASIKSSDALGLVTVQPGVDGESDTRGAAWDLRVSAFRDTIIYFRNHPSILVWEGGNQKVSREHGRELRSLMNQFDPHGGRAYAHRRADQITAEFMDIGIGTEGGREIPQLAVLEGEYNREESPRRVWDDASPPRFGYPEAEGQTYHLTSEQFAANQVAQYVRKLGAPDHCGGANWIFSDSTSGGRVACEVARASGEVDGVRLPKEAYYVCRAMFSSEPQVHIIGHWSYPAATKKTVYVAANADEVELFVNGKSLGRARPSDRFLFTFPEVRFEPGEIKAVAYRHGSQVTEQTKKTTGPPAALLLTLITAECGLRADGSDIALVDVEAVDASGRRCPTFEGPVRFELSGPGVWRGGYNSGKTNSINSTSLDLEAGINRVAIRSTRRPGIISLTATSPKLRSATLEISSAPAPIENGLSTALPWLPPVPLPAESNAEISTALQVPTVDLPRPEHPTGRFTRIFTYSGPSPAALKQDARNGKNIYTDRDDAFKALPSELVGADWIQVANADRRYSAIDLIEIAVPAGTVVSVAHDDRLPRPAWLAERFQPTSLPFSVFGKHMTVFQRRVDRDESLTLGGNGGDSTETACNMYIVFVKGPAKR